MPPLPPVPLLAALPWGHLALVLGGALLGMVALWSLPIARRNAAIVDVGWAAFLGLAAVGLAAAGSGPVARRALLAGMVGLWSARLVTHLVRERLAEGVEEGRYRRLRKRWGAKADRLFLPFFLAQGVLVAILSLPFLLAANDTSAFPAWWDVGALLLWGTAFALEALADRQLARFRARPDSRGRTCREGLWRLSRHPNYFFEWLQWCAFALLASGAPFGWLAWSAPLLLLVFVLKITGIPPTEAQALRTRGDDYRRYQATTSPFVPWFPRREETTT